jgi:transcriptional regulator with XRE-family HTH domain
LAVKRRYVVDAAEQRVEVAPGRAVEQLMGDLGLSKKELADALDATPRTLERWRAGGTYPQRDTRRRLAELVELDRHLQETFDDREAVRRWLSSPSRYLGGLRPVEAVRVGRVDRVEAALEALDSGVFV